MLRLAIFGSSIQRVGLFDSILLTSLRAASVSSRVRSTVTSIALTAQNDVYVTPCASSDARRAPGCAGRAG